MKKIAIVVSLALPVSALAGGFERNTQVPNFIFEDGRYAEIGISLANPDVEGSLPTAAGDLGSGGMVKSFNNLSFAYKAPLNETMDWAVSYSEPYGADVNYSNTHPFYPYNGSTAELNARSIAALLKYNIGDRVSVFGGAKAQQFEADANVIVSTVIGGAPVQALNYKGDSDPDIASGYLLGAAYEIKDIALRVALTYQSEIEHSNDVVESATGINPQTAAPFAIPGTPSSVDTTLPASINLAFQSGINPKTLLFGSVHWAEWTSTTIAPIIYGQVTGGQTLVEHSDDTTTINLGVARRLNENVALALMLGYEESTDKRSTNLAPTDGYTSVTLGGTFSEGNSKVRAGITYREVGDTFTQIGGVNSDFSGNTALGFGMTFGYTF